MSADLIYFLCVVIGTWSVVGAMCFVEHSIQRRAFEYDWSVLQFTIAVIAHGPIIMFCWGVRLMWKLLEVFLKFCLKPFSGCNGKSLWETLGKIGPKLSLIALATQLCACSNLVFVRVPPGQQILVAKAVKPGTMETESEHQIVAFSPEPLPTNRLNLGGGLEGDIELMMQ